MLFHIILSIALAVFSPKAREVSRPYSLDFTQLNGIVPNIGKGGCAVFALNLHRDLTRNGIDNVIYILSAKPINLTNEQLKRELRKSRPFENVRWTHFAVKIRGTNGLIDNYGFRDYADVFASSGSFYAYPIGAEVLEAAIPLPLWNTTYKASENATIASYFLFYHNTDKKITRKAPVDIFPTPKSDWSFVTIKK